MKKIFITAFIILFGINAFSQSVPCFIKYTYDNSGNRITREFVCESDPDPNVDTDNDDGGGGSSRFANTSQINNTISDFNFTVSPNPSAGEFKLHFDILPINFSLKVIDKNGKTVYSKQVISQYDNFNISSLSAGNYFVVVSDGKNKRIVKISKSE